MRVVEIRQGLATLCRRVLIGSARNLHEEDDLAQGVSHATSFQSEAADSQVGHGSQELQRQLIVPAAPLQPTSRPGNEKVNASELVKRILGENWPASVSNILVIQDEASRPLKRMEIHLARPEQVTAILKPLVSALQEGGFDLELTSNVSVPASDIWLICPLTGENKISVCSGAVWTENTEPAVALETCWNAVSASDWLSQPNIANALGECGKRVQPSSQNSHSAFAQGAQERANS